MSINFINKKNLFLYTTMKLDNKNAFYIHVSSNDRISGNNTNFTVDFTNNNSIIGKACFAILHSVEVCLGAIYQIKSGKNTFAFSVDGVSTISFDITPGSYTVTSICNLLKTQMESLDLVSNTYTFSYNNDINMISITPTYASGTFELRTNLNSEEINDILGLDSNGPYTISSATTYTFPLQVDMIPNYNYHLCCSVAVLNNINSGNNNINNSILKMNYGSRFVRNQFRFSDSDAYGFHIASFPTQMRFWIVDENNLTVDIPENLATSVSLKVFPL
jgi:hypothetical protein